MSKSPKILNIDDFARVERVIAYKGKEYPVLELTVQSFIDNLKAAEDLEKSGEKPAAPKEMSAQVEVSIKNILEAVPDFPEAELRQLKIPALTAIMHFIRGELDSGGGAPAEATEATDSKKN